MANTNVYYKTRVSNGFLGYYVHRPIPAHSSDRIIVLSEKYEHAPDLLAYELYGDKNLWWVIPQRNGLEDPVFDLVKDIQLIVPNLEVVKEVVK